MILTFDADHARKLLDLSKKTRQRRPTYAELYDQAYWRDDMPPERRQSLEAEIAEKGLAMGITSDDIDPDRLRPGLHLVGDQGVYLMSQAPIEEAQAAGVEHICYAREVDPTKLEFDEWWEAKRRSFGGDDGVELLDAETLDKVLAGAETLEIEMDENAMRILYPEGAAKIGTPDPSA